MGDEGRPRFAGWSGLERSLRSLKARYFPWLYPALNGFYPPDPSLYEPYENLDLYLDLIPAMILCHCPNIRRLDRLNIGIRGRDGSSDYPLLWKHLVGGSINFPNLESANLVTSYSISHDEDDGVNQTASFGIYMTPIVEVICFINRTPNLKHLSLTGFSTEGGGGNIIRVPFPPLWNLDSLELHNISSLELHYCAWLDETDLRNIVNGCPKLATFKFTSEASVTTGRPLPSSSGFDFVGPALVLKALKPRSNTLTAISIRYMPILDLAFRAHGSMDTENNLIRTLGHFPNLRVLQISYGALRWKDFAGPEEQQLIRLVNGCPSLESLDITQINVRKARIRLQLEGLTAGVANMHCAPLLKGIRVSIERHRPWSREGLDAYASELFEKDHLDIYQRRGIQL